MARRFVRSGLTAAFILSTSGGNGTLVAQAPVPAGNDDANGYSNLNTTANSDPLPVGGAEDATVTLYSDTTCSAGMQVLTGPTPTGPWLGIGSASVNPALATPVVVNVHSGGHVEYCLV